MVAKLTDVAELAGCSPTTVSRVINKKGYLSQKTIDKVQAAMKELNYKPNNLARSLQGKSAKLIGLIFPKISNVFYAELIEYLEIELFKQGYKVIICNSQSDPEKEQEYLEMLAANQVDGIISSSHNLGIADYQKVEAPIVSFDRNLAPDITVISSDNFAGGITAAKTLERAGCQRIMMITGLDNSESPTGLRRQGFQSILPDAKIFHLPLHQSTIRQEMEIKAILQQEKPDGLFVSNDLTALLTMQIAEDLRLSIPDDLKVIGYDGTRFIETYQPQLTTIKQPLLDIAKLLVDVLIKKIEGQTTNREYILPISLISGKSV